ncbi:MAG: bifunctional UDP-sugar hydrolase/5'-nucleotidase [Vicinamibacterales bacterium]
MAHRIFRHLLLSATLLFASTGTAAGQYSVPGAPRNDAPLTILQINDVYSTVAIEGRGGLARVATIKKQVAEAGGHPFLMLAGDFLSSSVSSSVFRGEQMVATLNEAGLDLATLGNHEFDFGVDVLVERMEQAEFTWVVSNVIDRKTGVMIGGAEPYVLRQFGPLTVGVLGLCIADDTITADTLQRLDIIDPIEAAQKYLPELQAKGADVIIALTHLAYRSDRELAERFPEIDVIVGGHEHFPITATVGRTLISKAGTEARYVARIDVTGDDGSERHFELMPVDGSIPEDPETARVANEYEARLDAALDDPVGGVTVDLVGVGARLRTSETNLGNLVADAARASVGAEIALVNGGGIRGDRVFAAGPISRRDLLQIHPFGNVVCVVEVPGRILLEALEHGVSGLPAPSGGFPQVSGFSMRVHAAAAAGSRVSGVAVDGEPLDPQRLYRLALPNFVLLGGDGYSMFEGQRVIVGPETGPTIPTALERHIAGRELSPATENRIVITR